MLHANPILSLHSHVAPFPLVPVLSSPSTNRHVIGLVAMSSIDLVPRVAARSPVRLQQLTAATQNKVVTSHLNHIYRARWSTFTRFI